MQPQEVKATPVTTSTEPSTPGSPTGFGYVLVMLCSSLHPCSWPGVHIRGDTCTWGSSVWSTWFQFCKAIEGFRSIWVRGRFEGELCNHCHWVCENDLCDWVILPVVMIDMTSNFLWAIVLALFETSNGFINHWRSKGTVGYRVTYNKETSQFPLFSAQERVLIIADFQPYPCHIACLVFLIPVGVAVCMPFKGTCCSSTVVTRRS